MKKNIFTISSFILILFEFFILYCISYRVGYSSLSDQYLRYKLVIIWLTLTFLVVIFIIILLSHLKVSNSKNWAKKYSENLSCTDYLIILWVIIGSQIFRIDGPDMVGKLWYFNFRFSYFIFCIFFSFIWFIALSLSNSKDKKIFGSGITEYKRVINATIYTYSIISILLILFRVMPARSFYFLSLPFGLFGLLLVRNLWRRWLVRVRVKYNIFKQTTIIVGTSYSDCIKMINELNASPDYAYNITGILLPIKKMSEFKKKTKYNVCFYTDISKIVQIMHKLNSNSIAIASKISSSQIRNLSWLLNETENLLIYSGIIGISQNRIVVKSIKTANIMNIITPKLNLSSIIIKRTTDVIVAVFACILLIPIYCIVGTIIKATSKGPVIYKQKRIGLNGKEFYVYKFRSMYINSDAQLKKLLKEQGTAQNPFFKINNDPRITKVGAFIRKWSIDEIPQFVNVLKGDMSLIGPRPQIKEEVSLYNSNAKRRLFLRPGITGLWQISGRSDINWKEAIRLDLYYVENWSLTMDMRILLNTFKVVLTHKGAV